MAFKCNLSTKVLLKAVVVPFGTSSVPNDLFLELRLMLQQPIIFFRSSEGIIEVRPRFEAQIHVSNSLRALLSVELFTRHLLYD